MNFQPPPRIRQRIAQVVQGIALLTIIAIPALTLWQVRYLGTEVSALKEHNVKAEAEQAVVVSDLRTQLTALEGQRSDLEEKVKQLQSDYNVVFADRQSLSQTVATQNGTIATQSAEMEGQRQQLAQLETRLGAMKSTLDSLEHERAGLRRTVQQLQDQLKNYQSVSSDDKEALLDLRWRNFLVASQLTICGKGTSSRLAACREEVSRELYLKIEERFRECSHLKQAAPVLIVGGTPTPNSVTLNVAHGSSAGAPVVALCDKSLPGG